MRIVSGLAKGRTIKAPKGDETRPTQDRIREAIFGMIQFEIYGKRVLDMFAGSGAMGLEALSREATSAVFFDVSREACAVVKNNLSDLCFAQSATVINMDYEKAMQYCKQKGQVFDIVFIDPPYHKGLCDAAIALLIAEHMLSEDCIIVAEHERSHSLPIPAEIEKSVVRTYGEVAVTVMRGVCYH